MRLEARRRCRVPEAVVDVAVPPSVPTQGMPCCLRSTGPPTATRRRAPRQRQHRVHVGDDLADLARVVIVGRDDAPAVPEPAAAAAEDDPVVAGALAVVHGRPSVRERPPPVPAEPIERLARAAVATMWDGMMKTVRRSSGTSASQAPVASTTFSATTLPVGVLTTAGRVRSRPTIGVPHRPGRQPRRPAGAAPGRGAPAARCRPCRIRCPASARGEPTSPRASSRPRTRRSHRDPARGRAAPARARRRPGRATRHVEAAGEGEVAVDLTVRTVSRMSSRLRREASTSHSAASRPNRGDERGQQLVPAVHPAAVAPAGAGAAVLALDETPPSPARGA